MKCYIVDVAGQTSRYAGRHCRAERRRLYRGSPALVRATPDQEEAMVGRLYLDTRMGETSPSLSLGFLAFAD